MRLIDFVLIVMIGSYCAYLLYKNHKRRKNGECIHECSGCSSYGVCHLDFKEICKENEKSSLF